MLMPILEERRSEKGDAIIKTISSRIAGGRKELNTEPSRVRFMDGPLPHAKLNHTRKLGHCRYARVPLVFTITSPCVGTARTSGHVDRWRLHPDPGYMRRAQEYTGSYIEFQ